MLLSKFSRIGKKEQPSDWPKHAENFEQIVDEVRRVASDVTKALNQHVLLGKRGKKNAEQQLAVAFKESIDKTSCEDKVFAHVVRESADIMNNLALLRRDFELKVEKSVVDPLNRLVDNTCSGIGKQRRTFNKAYSDARAAREQLQRAITQMNQLGGSNNGSANSFGGSSFNLNGSLGSLDGFSGPASGQAPSEAMTAALMRCNQGQTLLDDKERELLGCKEKLLRDLYSFIAHEPKEADLLVELMRAQETYLEESLQLVRKAIPTLSALIERQKPLTVFDRHLPDHLAETDRTISYVLETCITRLDNEATLQEEGLFRKSGSQQKTNLLVNSLNLMQADEAFMDSCDSMSVTVALKQYLNSLPEPLITHSLAEKWASASKTQGSATLELVQPLIQSMPQDFRLNLAYLCLFLHKLSSYSAVNKMTTDNLSIVIAPNLYRLPSVLLPTPTTSDNGTPGSTDLSQSLDFLQHSGPGIRLVNLLINHAETLFAEEKVLLKTLLPKEGTNRNQPQGHSRTPSNTSLLDAKAAKPIMQSRAPSDSVEEIPHLVSEVNTVPATGDSSLNAENSSVRPTATPQNSSRYNGKRPVHVPSRKKTIAPKPPIPAAPPSSLIVSARPPSPNLQPPSYENGSQEVVANTTTMPSPSRNDIFVQATNDPAPPLMIYTGAHFTRQDDSFKQHTTEEFSHSKAPPKRPPRPGAGTTPKLDR